MVLKATRVRRAGEWFVWDPQRQDYVPESPRSAGPPAPPLILPPLRPPDGRETVDPARTYQLISSDLRGSRLHECTGDRIEDMVIGANGGWWVVGDKVPVVPLVRIFDQGYGDHKRGDVMWCTVNEAHDQLRRAAVLLVDLDGNIRPHGRFVMHPAGLEAWSVFHQRRVAEAQAARERAAASPVPARVVESEERAPKDSPRARRRGSPWRKPRAEGANANG